MEPTNLNDAASASSEDPLDTRLRLSRITISDDGFSARVLTALPAGKTRAARFRIPSKWVFCGVGALAGFAFFFVRVGSWSNAENSLVEATSALSILTDPLVFWAVVATVVSLLLIPLGQNRRL